MLPALRPARTMGIKNRSFVSTVLLSKNWDNETAADLRKELKKRGLTSSGNKTTLITRLSEHDKRQQRDALTSSPMRIRTASFASELTEVPGIPNAPTPPPNARLDSLTVLLPDLTPPLEIESASIPFVPDFWDSSKVKSKGQQDPVEPLNPKILTVAGAAIHLGGGPCHNVYFESASPSSDHSREVSLFNKQGFWYDVFSDAGLPTAVKVPPVSFESKELPRADSTSSQGAWTLIGLLLGSWFVAGVAAPKSEIEGGAHNH